MEEFNKENEVIDQDLKYVLDQLKIIANIPNIICISEQRILKEYYKSSELIFESKEEISHGK